MKLSPIVGFVCFAVMGVVAQTADIHIVGASSVGSGADVHVVGASSRPVDGSSAPVPDIVVVGGHSIAAVATSVVPEVSVVGGWTMSEAAYVVSSFCLEELIAYRCVLARPRRRCAIRSSRVAARQLLSARSEYTRLAM